MTKWFTGFASHMATVAGHYQTFLGAILVIIVWAVSGPFFGFSDTWQLVINTFTTLVTFLMVFLIQNTQNRDARAMHLKLDELIRSIEAADNAIIRAEDETDEELGELKRKYEALIDEHEALKASLGRPAGSEGRADSNAPQLPAANEQPSPVIAGITS
jgi:low affinity Fe/Cu permease